MLNCHLIHNWRRTRKLLLNNFILQMWMNASMVCINAQPSRIVLIPQDPTIACVFSQGTDMMAMRA